MISWGERTFSSPFLIEQEVLIVLPEASSRLSPNELHSSSSYSMLPEVLPVSYPTFLLLTAGKFAKVGVG